MTPYERVATLRMIPEFRQIPPAELATLGSAMREEFYAAGEPVCIEGEVADRVFIVHEGEVSATQEGRSGFMQVVSRGGLFGEIAFFERGRRTATVTARSPCTILSLEFERFRKFLLANPESALILAERLARMLRSAEAMLVQSEER